MLRSRRRPMLLVAIIFSFVTNGMLYLHFLEKVNNTNDAAEIIDNPTLEKGNLKSPPTIKVNQTQIVTSAACPLAAAATEGNNLPGRKNGRPIQFIHIPKTGGTSVQNMLAQWAETAKNITTIHTFFLKEANSAEANAKRGLFYGHRGYGFSEALSTENPITIVVLRHPISRMISLYDYIVGHTRRMHGKVQNVWRRQTFDEVVQNYHKVVGTDSSILKQDDVTSFFHRQLHLQIRFLCGYNCLQEEAMEYQQMLKRARENLEKVDCVGVMDNMSDLLLQMKTHLDFIPREFTLFPHLNKVDGGKKSSASEETIAILERYLKDEIELYYRAREISVAKTSMAKDCL